MFSLFLYFVQKMEKVLLYIIGVVHKDLEGRERLRAFLNYAKPDLIGVEYDTERLENLIGKIPKTMDEIYDLLLSSRKKLIKKINYLKFISKDDEELKFLNSISEQSTASLYEIDEPVHYCKSTQQCKLEFIDFNFIGSKEEMREVSRSEDEAIIELEKELVANNLSYQEFFDSFYKLNRNEIEKLYSSDLKRNILDGKRNKYMSSTIMQLVRNNPNKTHVYIVGLLHLYTIANNLTTLSPIVMTLPEAYKMSNNLTTRSGK